MKTQKPYRLSIAHVLRPAMALVLTLLMMLGSSAGIVLAEDQPDGSIIIPTQTIDGTWGPGTITATADVTIQPGVVITIAPNTTVSVADGVRITVSGEMHSDGPVTFTGISATPGAWEGITYADGSSGYLDQATIEYAQHALTLNTSNPINISNSTLRYNRHAPGSGANALGAGMYIQQGNHVISNTYVHGNTAQASGNWQVRGAGIYIENGSPQILDSWIYENTATAANREAYGGGIGIAAGGALIENSHIMTNTIGGGSGSRLRSGAGIGIIGNTTAVIRGSWIAGNVNNVAGYAGGGGIGFNTDARASLIDGNVLSDNQATGSSWSEGGAIDAWERNAFVASNNLMINNHAPTIGGAININASTSAGDVHVINNTIVGNTARDGGGIYRQSNGRIYNNVVASNTSSGNGGGIFGCSNTYCGYNDVWNNTRNNYNGAPPSTDLQVDPLFLGTGDVVEQYHIRQISPVIDAGTNTATGLPNDDYDGQIRPMGTTWDMGFDEFAALYSKAVDADVASGGLELTYTIVVTNPGPYVALVGAQVTDALPANTSYSVGPNCNLGSCDYDSGADSVTWTGDIPSGSTLTLDYTVLVALGLADGTEITNQADIDVGALSDTTNTVTTVIYNPDLEVTKSADPEPVEAGGVLSYTIVVANNGLGDASGVTVSDPLPANTQFVPDSIVLDPPSAGSAGTTPPTLATDVRIGAGESIEITYQVTVDEPLDAGTIIQNVASATSVQDPTPATGGADSTVSTTPTVNVVKSGPSHARVDDTVDFVFTVTNVGNTLLHNVEVEDDYAGTATYVGGDDGDGWLDLTESWVYTASYTILAEDPDPLVNTVTVTASDALNTQTIDTDTHSIGLGPSSSVYLPIVFGGQASGLPDLVVEELIATSDMVTVTIKNQGNTDVSDAFWVDVYFDPSETPGLNKPWDTIASYGAVWGVTTPIPAGGSLTLTTGGDYYFPGYSSPTPLPVEADVYALVDSINFNTDYGAVLEGDENNNLLGPVTSTASVTGKTTTDIGGQSQPASREGLPGR